MTGPPATSRKLELEVFAVCSFYRQHPTYLTEASALKRSSDSEGMKGNHSQRFRKVAYGSGKCGAFIFKSGVGLRRANRPILFHDNAPPMGRTA